jgi:chromosome segregation ATPase
MIAPLPEGEFAVRDGAFDAVIVPDLTLFDQVDSIVSRARKLVANHGHALFISPNPESMPEGSKAGLLSYYELYDVIALQFPEVRMLGQAPFAGYVIADFAPEGELDVVLDTSLADQASREPRFFVALGTHQPRRLDPYTVIQVSGAWQADDSALRQRVDTLEKALAEAVPVVPIVPAVPAVPAVPRAPTDRMEDQQVDLQRREELLRQAEARAGDNHVRAERLGTKVRDLEEELRHQRERAFRLSNELEEEKKLRTKVELELRMVRSKSDMPPAVDPNAQAEIERLRTAFAQADQQVVILQSRLEEAQQRLMEAERELSHLRDEYEDMLVAKKQGEARVMELQKEVKNRDHRIEELDGLVVELQSGPSELERELKAARQQEQQLRSALQEAMHRSSDESALRNERQEAQRMLERLRAEQEQVVAALQHERDDALARLNDRDFELVSMRARLGELNEASHASDQKYEELRQQRDDALQVLNGLRQEQEYEVSALERSLQGRGREIQSLRSEIAHHERLVRELVHRLELGDGIGEPTGEDALRGQLGMLMAEAARREGELQQARWRIGELEQKLHDQRDQEPSAQVAMLEQALFAAQNEKDALRQALAAAQGIGQDEPDLAHDGMQPTTQPREEEQPPDSGTPTQND